MDFVDAILVRLADAASRASLFDEVALAQLVAASGDVDGLGVAAPFSAIFDEVRLCYQDDRAVAIHGSWMMLGHTERTELALHAAGLVAPVPRIDALWTGAVEATAGGGDARVDRVDLSYLDLTGLDREIIPLPSDPAALERQRRAHLAARIRTRLDQPAAFDDAALDRWLAELGVTSVGALLSGPQAAAGATVRVHYAPGAAAATAVRRFAVAAALLIRPAPISLAGLLDETRRVRPYLDRLGFAAPPVPDRRARRTPLVIWVVPAALFDDPAWPGGAGATPDQQRTGRRMWAGGWLAREGVGLVVPPTN